MRQCPACRRGRLVEVEDIISEVEGHHFVVKGRRCGRCKEEFVDEKEGERMIVAARRIGLWGEPLKLHRKLSRSGRGTILRIPSDIEKNLQLKGDEEVLISRVGKRKILVEL